jgi:peroxiredoxin
MTTSILLLSCALIMGQATDRTEWQLSPQLSPGLELTYTGEYLEESLIPNVQHQRVYRIETNVLILETGVKDWQASIMTGVSLRDGRKPLDKKDGPLSVRVEMARIDLQGRVRQGDKKILEIPRKGPPTLETGFVVPAPLLKLKRGSTWDVGEDGQPAQRWQIVGTESCAGVTCIKIVGVQQSADWGRTRADQCAWQRRDTIWLHPQLNVAQKVERIIEHCAPARDVPTHRTIVRYDLQSRPRYPNFAFEERKKEAVKACKFSDVAQPLLKQPAANRIQIDSLLRQVVYHLDHQPETQATPYRKAIVHIKTMLEKAQKGEVPVPSQAEEPPVLSSKAVAIGERVPDCAISSLTDEKITRLKNMHGKPIVIFFYNPATPLGKEILGYAKRLSENQAGQLGIMALAVTSDEELARNQHKEMRLTFPILDGSGLRLLFGADQTPRFVVIDCDGLVRFAQTGWGVHTSIEIEEAIRAGQRK